MAKRRPKSSTAPDGFLLVHQGISLARTQTKDESGLRVVRVPLTSVRFPGQRSESSNDLLRISQDDCHCICDFITLLMESGCGKFILAGSVQ